MADDCNPDMEAKEDTDVYEEVADVDLENLYASLPKFVKRKPKCMWILLALALVVCLATSVTALTTSGIALQKETTKMPTFPERNGSMLQHGPTGNIDQKCPLGYRRNPYAKSCIRLVNSPKTWHDAKQYCEENGEYLATFTTLESLFWFKNLRAINRVWKLSAIWVGGRKDEYDIWQWVGKYEGPARQMLWKKGQPNNAGGNQNCLSNTEKEHEFSDEECTDLLEFVCELHDK